MCVLMKSCNLLVFLYRADGEVLFHVKGSEVNTDYFEKHGFTHPLLVEEKEGLGIKVPPLDFTVADVERCVGRSSLKFCAMLKVNI